MAYDITHAYGLKDTDFEIRINNRKVMNYVTREVFGLNEETAQMVAKLIDKKEKLAPALFQASIAEAFAVDPELRGKDETFLTLLNSKNFDEFLSRLPQTTEEHEGLKEIRQVIAGLEKLGITNARFDQTLMRGFDYYTGIVFEVFDLDPVNRRSVFGGGRYDDLLSLFGNDKVSAVGFGAGDVIARDLMETYRTLPMNVSPADIAICVMGEENAPYAFDVAQSLRAKGMRIAVDLSGKKVGDQIKNADKKSIPKVIVIGEEEVKTGKLKAKVLATGEEVVIE
jgi:histidyl-tRNA synthetase